MRFSVPLLLGGLLLFQGISEAYAAPRRTPVSADQLLNIFVTADGNLCIRREAGAEALEINGLNLSSIAEKAARRQLKKLKRALAGKKGPRKKRRMKAARALVKHARSCATAEPTEELPPALPPIFEEPTGGDNDGADDDRDTFPACLDNGDGVINSADISAFLSRFVMGQPGADFNGDGVLNSNDIQEYLSAWHLALTGTYECPSTPSPAESRSASCFDGLDNDLDGVVDLADFDCTGPFAAEPEPGLAPGSLDRFGWTYLKPSADSRVVYVSSSTGNDSNNGLSPETAVATAARGYALLRNGYPDYLLFKRGDEFVDGRAHSDAFFWWMKNGRSRAERMVIGSYGHPLAERPRFLTGRSPFLVRTNASNRGNHLAIVGIEMTPHLLTSTTSSPALIDWLGDGENLLIEDCKLRQAGMVIEGHEDWGSPGNIALRRNHVSGAYALSGAGHRQGLYAELVNGLLLEENVFDQNGHNPDIPGARPTIFNHNVYIDNGVTGLVARGNISLRASSHGLQARPGGLIEYNLMVRNPLGLQVGGGDPDEHTHVYGITGTVRHNVVLDGTDIDAATPRGQGMLFTNIGVQGLLIEHNIVANLGTGSGVNAYDFAGGARVSQPGQSYGTGVGVNHVLFQNNIAYNWRSPLLVVSGPATSITDGFPSFNSVSGNVFADNILMEPTRTTPVVAPFSLDQSAVRFVGNRYFNSSISQSAFRVGPASNPATLTYAKWLTQSGEEGSSFLPSPFPDPTRDVGDYNATLGGENSLEAFAAALARQSKTDFRPEYTARAVIEFIEEGFGR